jgi:shikimate dehydrogenase
MSRTLLGVAGHPVGHSRSPAMHNAALAALGMDWLYVPLPLPPERFSEAAAALEGSGFRGINVTVPHKVAAYELAHEHSEASEAIGAANTLAFAEGRIAAENTDAQGFLDALAESPTGKRALVLGAGGAARAVVWALLQSGAAEVSVLNRTRDGALALAREMGARQTDRAEPSDLLVNCTSVGLGDGIAVEQAVDELGLTALDPPATVVDLVYGDEATPVAEWAVAAGSRVVEGVEVLVRQGARSLELWTGREAPIEVMRRAARASYQADSR